MKKFTYEVSIEAEHKDDADTRMKGLSLLTQSPVLEKEPLSKEEETLLKYYREGNHMVKLSLLAVGTFFKPVKRPIEL